MKLHILYGGNLYLTSWHSPGLFVPSLTLLVALDQLSPRHATIHPNSPNAIGRDLFIILLRIRVSIGVSVRLTSFAHQPPNADHSFLQIIFCHTPTNSEMPPKAIVDRGDNSIPRPRSGRYFEANNNIRGGTDV